MHLVHKHFPACAYPEKKVNIVRFGAQKIVAGEVSYISTLQVHFYTHTRRSHYYRLLLVFNVAIFEHEGSALFMHIRASCYECRASSNVLTYRA